MVVREHLEKAGLGPIEVTLGEAAFPRNLTGEEIAKAKSVLEPLRFGFIDDRKRIMTKQVKQAIIGLVHQDSLTDRDGERSLKTNLSEHLSRKQNCDYRYFSGVFSDIENVTIEQFTVQEADGIHAFGVQEDKGRKTQSYRLDLAAVHAPTELGDCNCCSDSCIQRL